MRRLIAAPLLAAVLAATPVAVDASTHNPPAPQRACANERVTLTPASNMATATIKANGCHWKIWVVAEFQSATKSGPKVTAVGAQSIAFLNNGGTPLACWWDYTRANGSGGTGGAGC
jgi:hypothetical protein